MWSRLVRLLRQQVDCCSLIFGYALWVIFKYIILDALVFTKLYNFDKTCMLLM